MTHKQRTKDENFMICLYEQAIQSGDFDTPQDRYEVGRIAGIQPKAVDAICKLLIQANFIKKESETNVYLTPHGEKLVQNLLRE